MRKGYHAIEFSWVKGFDMDHNQKVINVFHIN